MTIEVNGDEIYVRCGSGDDSLMLISTDGCGAGEGGSNFNISIADEFDEMNAVLVLAPAEMLMLASLLEYQARKLLDAQGDAR